MAYQVAQALEAPLDVFIVRKLGVPGHEELAMGAIASGGVPVMNEEVLRHLPIPPQRIEEVTERERRELEWREHAYRGSRPPLDVRNRTVIIVDDGLATGRAASARAVRRPGWYRSGSWRRTAERRRPGISAEREMERVEIELVKELLVASRHCRAELLALRRPISLRCGRHRTGVGAETDETRVLAVPVAHELAVVAHGPDAPVHPVGVQPVRLPAGGGGEGSAVHLRFTGARRRQPARDDRRRRENFDPHSRRSTPPIVPPIAPPGMAQ
ncbi:MAG TPA: hypothetical protein VNA04_14195 [Thermoanaerobaculia bacterium]|nr:hypothetical protein [Thermoanaerobaculia bacterium]